MDKLIPGIFNYCDRWCERCDYADRCRLFQSETERNIQHILNDEDPNDPDIVAQDISESLQDAFEMLKEQMEIEGIATEDIEDCEDEDSQFFIDNFDDEREEVSESGRIIKSPHPLASQTDNFFKDVIYYFNKIKIALPDAISEIEPVNNPLYEEIKILLWYSPQIAVKTRMCVGSKASLENSKSNDDEFEVEMMNVNSRIAFTGMETCLNSLQKVYQLETNYSDDVLSLLAAIKRLKDEFEKEFPSVHTFKRPYFD